MNERRDSEPAAQTWLPVIPNFTVRSCSPPEANRIDIWEYVAQRNLSIC